MYQNEYLVCGPPNFPKTNSDKSFTKIQFELIYVSQSLNVVTIFFFLKEISLVRFILVKHLLL